MSWRMFYVHLKRICILLLLDGVFCEYLKSIWSNAYFKSNVSLLIIWMIYPLMKVWYSSPLLFLYCCQFLPLGLLIFALCIYVLLLRCTNIYKCYILLLDWPLYHYIVTFFVSYYTFCLKVYFVRYKYSYPRFLLVSICVVYLFPSFHFQSVFLKLKWIFCRQRVVGSCFLSIQPFCLLIGEFSPLHLK